MTATPIACHVDDKVTAAAHAMIDVRGWLVGMAGCCGLLLLLLWRLLNSCWFGCVPGTPESCGTTHLHAPAPRPCAQNHIHRVPVVDGDGKCIGIVTRTDLFWELASASDRTEWLEEHGVHV